MIPVPVPGPEASTAASKRALRQALGYTGTADTPGTR